MYAAETDVDAGLNPVVDIASIGVLALEIAYELFSGDLFAPQFTGQVNANRPRQSHTQTDRDCTQVVLEKVNKQFGNTGLNLTQGDVSDYQGAGYLQGGRQVNVNVGSGNLTTAQFNAIQPGSYAPGGFFGWLTGYGPSLHIVDAASKLDQSASSFANSNVGGSLFFSVTVHIDSAWANNPIGALLHWIIDVLGKNTRNPCPK